MIALRPLAMLACPGRALSAAVPLFLLSACGAGPDGNWPSLSVPPTGAVSVSVPPQPDPAPAPPEPVANGDVEALTAELAGIEARWEAQLAEARASAPGLARDRALSRLDAIFLEAPALAAGVVAPDTERVPPAARAFIDRVEAFRGRHLAALADLGAQAG